MKNLFNFLQYNNIVPISLGILFLGGTSAFAMTNPEAIYSETETVISIDNTYLVNKNLSTYKPKVSILSVTEDEENFYLDYRFYTIDIADHVWQDVVRDDTMVVSKADLGRYRDLGLYVTDQLKQMAGRESGRLAKTQENMRNAISQKTVAKTYGGLIGKFIDTSTETLPGYEPVVNGPNLATAAIVYGPGEKQKEPVKEVKQEELVVKPAEEVKPEEPEESEEGNVEEEKGTLPEETGENSTPPTEPVLEPKIELQLLGEESIQIAVGTTYTDLGAVLLDPYDTNVEVLVFVDDVQVAVPKIITTDPASYTIEYRATDAESGVSVSVKRVVSVVEAELTPSGGETPSPDPVEEPPLVEDPIDAESEGTETETPPVEESPLPEEEIPPLSEDPEPTEGAEDSVEEETPIEEENEEEPTPDPEPEPTPEPTPDETASSAESET